MSHSVIASKTQVQPLDNVISELYFTMHSHLFNWLVYSSISHVELIGKCSGGNSVTLHSISVVDKWISALEYHSTERLSDIELNVNEASVDNVKMSKEIKNELVGSDIETESSISDDIMVSKKEVEETKTTIRTFFQKIKNNGSDFWLHLS